MHFDSTPLETSFTEALCLDLTHVPGRTDIKTARLEAAERAADTEGSITDFPGLTKASATWLSRKGITAFTVKRLSPGRSGRRDFGVRHGCLDLGSTHDGGVVNLDKVVGKGGFRFITLPLRIKGGTGRPLRAGTVRDA